MAHLVRTRINEPNRVFLVFQLKDWFFSIGFIVASSKGTGRGNHKWNTVAGSQQQAISAARIRSDGFDHHRASTDLVSHDKTNYLLQTHG